MNALECTTSVAACFWIGTTLWWLAVGYSDFALGMAVGSTWGELLLWRARIAQGE